MTLDNKEFSRRSRVVHGWRFDSSLSLEDKRHIKRYLEGDVDRPPVRYVRIDEVCK